MLVAREGLGDDQEASYGAHEVVERGESMISGDGVVHGLPESLDDIDPVMVDRLEQQRDPRVVSQPG